LGEGVLFLFIGIVASALLIFEVPTLRTVATVVTGDFGVLSRVLFRVLCD
jgi:hypothetical protein